MTDTKTAELAFGRILRMASRSTQPGDVADYEKCRRIILDALDPDLSIQQACVASQHDYGRDRLRGAQGDWR